MTDFHPDAPVYDISLTDEFMEQWCAAPPRVRRKIDDLFRMTLDAGRFPKAFKAHALKSKEEDVVVGWVTRSRGYWRMLFRYEDGMVEIFWLGNKNEQLKVLRRYV